MFFSKVFVFLRRAFAEVLTEVVTKVFYGGFYGDFYGGFYGGFYGDFYGGFSLSSSPRAIRWGQEIRVF